MDVSSSVLEKDENVYLQYNIISTAATLVPAATSNHTYLPILAMALCGITVNCFITYTLWYILIVPGNSYFSVTRMKMINHLESRIDSTCVFIFPAYLHCIFKRYRLRFYNLLR